ncbi:serine threonine kinase protein [Rutstroemia sp. NJR-2017a BVV2]|nr:serine threonine kinase protein [Rutstroemia sp. NJR-2017a BVV2]
MDPLPPFLSSPASSTNDIFSFEELLTDKDFSSWVDLNCWSDFTDSSIGATTAGGLHSGGSPASWSAFVGAEGEGNCHSASSPNTSSLGSLPSVSAGDILRMAYPRPPPSLPLPTPPTGRSQDKASMVSSYQLMPQSSKSTSMNWHSNWGQTPISASYDGPSSALYTPASSTTSPASTTYPPVPNQPLSLITPLIDPTPFTATLSTSTHKFHSHPLVYKSGATPHELRMHLAAGSSAITLHGTVSQDPCSSTYPYTSHTHPHPHTSPSLTGLILSLETPLKPRTYTPQQRAKLTSSMKTCVLTLHARGIIHGDIHLSNFLLCSTDSSVRLTNFQDASYESESSRPEQWTPITSGTIISPNRARLWLEGVDRRANKEDDLFALGICVWEVWTGRRYVDGGGGMGGWEKKGGWEALRRGKCVNVGLVGDKGTRAMLRGWLRGGGGVV